MIIGDPSILAIESHILKAFHRLSFRALGSFTIHVNGIHYGVDESDATMLANSLDAVVKRIANRGNHITKFTYVEAGIIANAYRHAIYGKEYGESYFAMSAENFANAIHASHIQWAPDGDEAFDDGSYILQFDAEERVRIIAFRCGEDGQYDASSLTDLWMANDAYYGVLQRWHDSFLATWLSLPKVDD